MQRLRLHGGRLIRSRQLMFITGRKAMKFRRCLVCLLLGMLSGGCSAKTVTVADEAEFAAMVRRLAPVMQQHDIVDSRGAYSAPLLSASVPDQLGTLLFERLSPAFRFRLDPALLPPTFAASRSPSDSLLLQPSGFILRQGAQEVRVALVAVTDWNNDGADDWLLLCRVRSATDRSLLDYYLLIEHPDAARLIPRVIGVYDCRSGTCTLTTEGAPGGNAVLHPEAPVIEVEAGRQVVTPPPGSPLPQGASRPQGIEERRLAD